ncbi:MAG: hypothetical protein QF535_11270, partial [Anaerolineales bacterium]|nr:hypothetical protein [Anaerolineales bacterium]
MGTIQIDGSTPKLTIGNATAEDATILFDGNAQDFYIALDDSADDLLIGLGSTVGTTPIIAIDENKLSTFSGAITVGVDDTGHDVKLFGATAGSFALWDESADSLLLTDSTPIKIGDSQDLTLYHDGSNSYITNAVGALKIATETSGIALTIGHTTSEVTIGDNLTTTGTLTVGSTGITANGITVADQWRLTSNITATTGSLIDITANLEQVDTGGQGTLGSAMTESSGIFTFPSTGIYRVFYVVTVFDNVDTFNYFNNKISITTDNSSYTVAAQGVCSMTGEEGLEDYPSKSATIDTLVDVTNTT